MKKRITAVLAVALLVTGLSGCVRETENGYHVVNSGRFTEYVPSYEIYRYVVDNTTGVVYLKYRDGITVLVNKDGSPITVDMMEFEQ